MAGVMPIILGSGINRVAANITIASDTANYTFNTAKVAGYSAGKTDATLTINSGIFVFSGSTGSYALTVDTSWDVGDTVTIINNGVIVGKGGEGGSGYPYAGSPGKDGKNAGPALLVQRALTMNNLNRIAGGGGGGGGGGYGSFTAGKSTFFVSGGGGGGGIGNGNGGPTFTPLGGSPGSSGTLASAGSGGSSGGAQAGNGGSGGSYGSNGVSGGPSSGPGSEGPGSGGAAGACIVGNSNITYTNTGTRNGSIS
jgi:hypothetical protein